MALELPNDFVEYLLIGGYAVGYYGYPRATGDMDIWIACEERTAEHMVQVYREFGLVEGIQPSLFLNPRGILRMGLPTHCACCRPHQRTRGLNRGVMGLKQL